MASIRIKATYSLDVDTVRTLEGMARRWEVSKSEALRRAIRFAAAEVAGEEADPLGALTSLQKGLGLDEGAAREWARQTRAERRASSERREGGGR